MKIARIGIGEGPRYALLDEEAGEYIVLSDDPMFGQGNPTNQRVKADAVRTLSPMIPRSKVIGFGGTYEDQPPATINDLTVFIKPNTSVIGPDDPIVIPPHMDGAVHEVELAVVIGGVGKDVPVERALELVYGYTVANDVTGICKNFAVAKGSDTFCPIGPVIETELETSGLELVSRVNGQERRRGNTGKLVFSVAELIAHASRMFTLLPGDIILTGTPAGEGEILDGQSVECEVEGIGTLRNPVVKA